MTYCRQKRHSIRVTRCELLVSPAAKKQQSMAFAIAAKRLELLDLPAKKEAVRTDACIMVPRPYGLIYSGLSVLSTSKNNEHWSITKQVSKNI